MKSISEEISDRNDFLVDEYRKVLELEEKCSKESNLTKKLKFIEEAKTSMLNMKNVLLWADDRLKDKGNAFNNNYISIKYRYQVYMEIIFKSAVENNVEHNNDIFAKAMLEKNNKILDFNGADCFNNCPINMAIKYQNKSLFNYLLNHVKENGHGVIINFAKDTDENNKKFEKVRTIKSGDFVFQASPLFTALSLFNKEDKDYNIAYFVNLLVLKGGIDLPDTLYKDVPAMKNVIDFIEVYREGILNGFDKCEYRSVKDIVPIVSQNMELGPKLAFDIKIEDYAPRNYIEVREFSDATLYTNDDLDMDD